MGLSETDVCEALTNFGPLWAELFPAEQSRIVRLLVERVQLNEDSVDVTLRLEGFTSLSRHADGVTCFRREVSVAS